MPQFGCSLSLLWSRARNAFRGVSIVRCSIPILVACLFPCIIVTVMIHNAYVGALEVSLRNIWRVTEPRLAPAGAIGVLLWFGLGRSSISKWISLAILGVFLAGVWKAYWLHRSFSGNAFYVFGIRGSGLLGATCYAITVAIVGVV